MVTESLALIPFVLVSVFAVFGGVEFGMPLAAFLPDNKFSQRGWRFFSPAWELLNLLLIAAAVVVDLLYTADLPFVVPKLQTLWTVIVVLLLLRLVLILVNGFWRGDATWVRWLLVIVSLALPALMAQTLTVMLTGDSYLPWHPWLAAVLGATAVAATVALWSGWAYRPGHVVREVARRSYAVLVVLTAVFVPLAILTEPAVQDGRNVLVVAWPLLVGIAAGLPILMWTHRRRYFTATAVLVTGLGISLLRLQEPYLLRPEGLRLDQLSADAYTQIGIGLGFILVAFVAVTWLLVRYDRWQAAR